MGGECLISKCSKEKRINRALDTKPNKNQKKIKKKA
jgi:hypothetical protein